MHQLDRLLHASSDVAPWIEVTWNPRRVYFRRRKSRLHHGLVGAVGLVVCAALIVDDLHDASLWISELIRYG